MSFFEELKRRNVVRVGIAYIISAWLLLQLTEVLVELLDLPGIAGKFVILLLVIGFIPALIFAWAFEMTPDGIKREKDIGRGQSITKQTGRKLDFTIIGILVLVVGYLLVDKLLLEDAPGPLAENVSAETPGATITSVTQKTDASPVSPNSIAVLPFANRSNVDDDLFFTDGIHDDLLTQLAKISGLKVISRTSVMEYRDTTKKIPEIAAELGVSKILEGGIQRAGKRIRINAQLIDVSNDQHLWAETFDREMTVENLFDIQSEITRAIVTAVSGEMGNLATEKPQLAPTGNLQAYEAYMHARAATQEADYAIEKYLRAQQWAEKAVALDPGFAWAWSILVEAHCQAIWIGYDTSRERFAAAKTALDRVMAINPNSGEAQAALGEYRYRIEGDYPGAFEAFKKAAVLQPGNADIQFQLALTQRRLSTFNDAIKTFENAIELDPGNLSAVGDYLHTLLIIKDWERAQLLIDQAIERFPTSDSLNGRRANLLIKWKGDLVGARTAFNKVTPSAGDVYFWLATVLPLYERDLDAALEIWENPAIQTYASFGKESAGLRDLELGKIYLLRGEQALAMKHFQAARSSLEITVTKGTKTITIASAFELTNLATAYALLGENEAALKASQKALDIVRAGTDRYEGASVEGFQIYILALTGQRQKALQELERLIDTPGSYLTRWELTLDPRWDFFRDDERFNNLVRPLNLQEAGK